MTPKIEKCTHLDLRKERIKTSVWEIIGAVEESRKHRLWKNLLGLFEHSEKLGLVIQKDILKREIFGDKKDESRNP